MKFVLNREIADEDKVSADLTLLRYLREQKKLCGTKEGCASGDCGACTVLVGAPNGDGIEYQTINACIAPLAAVAGKHVVTVEHLAKQEKLHPVQEAMVRCHGSQCGYCTPGFVMSLAGLYQDKCQAGDYKVSRDEVCEAISGNLCRCTGYRPIISAGMTMLEGGEQSIYDDQIIDYLNHKVDQEHADYKKPRSIDDLLAILEAMPEAKLIAGGTDLMLSVTQQFQSIPALVDLSAVAELNVNGVIEGRVVIGAAVTYTTIGEVFAERFPRLCEFLKRFGSQQIRNRGTIGGNIANASPIADMPPILLAMDAQVTLSSSTADQRHIPIDEFYLGYKKTVMRAKECIVSVSFDQVNLDDFHQFYKISKRIEDDISSVMLAVRFSCHNGKVVLARIAYGGVAATPLRVKSAEAAFVGARMDDDEARDRALACIRAELRPIDDVRASANYRLDMAVNLLIKSWMALNQQEVPSIGTQGQGTYA